MIVIQQYFNCHQLLFLHFIVGFHLSNFIG